MHALIRNGSVEQYPYTIGNLRRDNPGVSFPKHPSEEMLAEWGMYPVAKVDRPNADHTKNFSEGTPVFNGGSWTQVWETTDATAEQVAQRVEQLSASARNQRNDLLRETDHFALSDVTMSAEMTTYRQALRDVPQQAGFPSTITWPTKPE